MRKNLSCERNTKQIKGKWPSIGRTKSSHRNWLSKLVFNCLETVQLDPHSTPYYKQYAPNFVNNPRATRHSWLQTQENQPRSKQEKKHISSDKPKQRGQKATFVSKKDPHKKKQRSEEQNFIKNKNLQNVDTPLEYIYTKFGIYSSQEAIRAITEQYQTSKKLFKKMEKPGDQIQVPLVTQEVPGTLNEIEVKKRMALLMEQILVLQFADLKHPKKNKVNSKHIETSLGTYYPVNAASKAEHGIKEQPRSEKINLEPEPIDSMITVYKFTDSSLKENVNPEVETVISIHSIGSTSIEHIEVPEKMNIQTSIEKLSRRVSEVRFPGTYSNVSIYQQEASKEEYKKRKENFAKYSKQESRRVIPDRYRTNKEEHRKTREKPREQRKVPLKRFKDTKFGKKDLKEPESEKLNLKSSDSRISTVLPTTDDPEKQDVDPAEVEKVVYILKERSTHKKRSKVPEKRNTQKTGAELKDGNVSPVSQASEVRFSGTSYSSNRIAKSLNLKTKVQSKFTETLKNMLKNVDPEQPELHHLVRSRHKVPMKSLHGLKGMESRSDMSLLDSFEQFSALYNQQLQSSANYRIEATSSSFISSSKGDSSDQVIDGFVYTPDKGYKIPLYEPIKLQGLLEEVPSSRRLSKGGRKLRRFGALAQIASAIRKFKGKLSSKRDASLVQPKKSSSEHSTASTATVNSSTDKVRPAYKRPQYSIFDSQHSDSDLETTRTLERAWLLSRQTELKREIARIMKDVDILEVKPLKSRHKRNFLREAQQQSWETPPSKDEMLPKKKCKSMFPTILEKLVIPMPSDMGYPSKPFVIRRYRKKRVRKPKIIAKDCVCDPCDTCQFFGLGKLEADPPLIREMKAKWQRMELWNYYRFVKQREALAQSVSLCRRKLSASIICP